MYYPCMTPRRTVPWPMALLFIVPMLFELVPIVLAAAGIKVTPWPGLLVLCVFLLVAGLVPVVFMAVGIRLTRTRTLIGEVCLIVGASLIFVFGWHLVVGGLVVGGLMLAYCVPFTFRAYARLPKRDSNAGPTA